MSKLTFHYLLILYVDESEAGSPSHVAYHLRVLVLFIPVLTTTSGLLVQLGPKDGPASWE
jgi:hypothetical protein